MPNLPGASDHGQAVAMHSYGNIALLPAVVLMVLPWASACDEQPPPSVAVTPSTAELTALGATVQLGAEVTDQYGNVMAGVEVGWSSSAAPVATVDASGLVTAVGNGTATITAKSGGGSGTAVVRVMQSVASVLVSPYSDTVEIDDSVRLTAKAFDRKQNVVEGAKFMWASSDLSVATVSNSGFVRGKTEGATRITATAETAEGSAMVTVFHPDRRELEGLYRATDGPDWNNNDNWMTDAPLAEWYGVEMEAGKLTGLDLRENRLSGSIPPSLGNLANLAGLDLAYNLLSGTIPPQLGNLANLTWLDFGHNRFSGPIPPQLADLANLTWLGLGNNQLSGPIPPQLADLANLTWLDLGNNQLSGPVPPELRNLRHLTGLLLQENTFGGQLPSVLGDLTALRLLHLHNNNLTGPIPARFDRMSRLQELILSYNEEMGGPLPSQLTSLRELDVLLAVGTELCAPPDPDVQTWLEGIYKRRIDPCDADPLMAYLAQAVQSRFFPVPLVAEENALLRVFVTAKKATSEGIPPIRARFYVNGRETHVEEIPGKSTPIPTEVDEGDLTKSANAEIAAEVIEPGLEMVIKVDPEGTLDEELGVPKRIPETGRLAVDVGAMPVFDLTLIPFVSASDSSIVELVEAMADDPDDHPLLWDTRTLLPIGDLVVTAHEPVLTNSPIATELLRHTIAIRAAEGGKGHYMGMKSPPVAGARGVALLPGRSSFSIPDSWVMSHELGHNLSLYHAPCGASNWLDPSYPYPTGSIGAWGYDFREGGSMVRRTRSDLMSYCPSRWISDYHFANGLRFRLSDADSAGLSYLGRQKSLLLWGGVDTDGLPFLEPALVLDAPPTLPRSGGEYRVTGRTGGGTELFSLSFAMPEVADGDGSASFAFTLPARAGWEGRLATITLTGPVGSATLDAGSDLPVVMLRNPRTGRVRAILRDPPKLSMRQADVAAALGAEPGLEVLFSRGIPDATAWRR